MKRLYLFAVKACLFLLIFSSAASAFDSPLMVKNQFPLFMHVNSPRLESAAAENSFSAGLSYSSVFMVLDSAHWSVSIDHELAELSLGYRKTFGPVELGVEVPIVIFTSGALDGFLSSYHKTFGFSDYGRASRSKDAFLYEVRKDGKTVIKGTTGGSEIGDIRLTAKYVLRTVDPVVSVAANIELPTGDAKKGFGNGSVDGGLAVMVDKQLGEKFKTYFNAGIVFPGDLRAYDTIPLRNFWFAGTAVEAAFWKSVSLLGQVTAQGSPYPKTGIGPVDRISVLLTLGARHTYGKNTYELTLSEDPNTAGAPDISFGLFFKRRF